MALDAKFPSPSRFLDLEREIADPEEISWHLGLVGLNTVKQPKFVCAHPYPRFRP